MGVGGRWGLGSGYELRPDCGHLDLYMAWDGDTTTASQLPAGGGKHQSQWTEFFPYHERNLRFDVIFIFIIRVSHRCYSEECSLCLFSMSYFV